MVALHAAAPLHVATDPSPTVPHTIFIISTGCVPNSTHSGSGSHAANTRQHTPPTMTANYAYGVIHTHIKLHSKDDIQKPHNDVR